MVPVDLGCQIIDIAEDKFIKQKNEFLNSLNLKIYFNEINRLERSTTVDKILIEIGKNIDEYV